MSYDTKWMHAQNHPAWKNNMMGKSGQTIGAKGCFISCLTYIWARKSNQDRGIPETVDLMNKTNGFTLNGDTIHVVVEHMLGLRISLSKPLFGKVYIMRNVSVRGKNNLTFSHWVVELAGNQMYDPLFAGGNFVHDMNFYPAILSKPDVINRRYVM